MLRSLFDAIFTVFRRITTKKRFEFLPERRFAIARYYTAFKKSDDFLYFE